MITLPFLSSVRLVEKWQHDQAFGIESVLRANILRQGKKAFRLRLVALVKASCRETVIARKELLRLATLFRDLERLHIAADSEVRAPVALMNLRQHDQRDGRRCSR